MSIAIERLCLTCPTRFITANPEALQCGSCKRRGVIVPADLVQMAGDRLHSLAYQRALRRRQIMESDERKAG